LIRQRNVIAASTSDLKYFNVDQSKYNEPDIEAHLIAAKIQVILS